jgi:hypothetical protein
VQSENEVEWELVNYGAGAFYVASYQDRPGAEAQAEAAPEPLATVEDVQIPNCFFYRCWSALRDGCGAA